MEHGYGNRRETLVLYCVIFRFGKTDTPPFCCCASTIGEE